MTLQRLSSRNGVGSAKFPNSKMWADLGAWFGHGNAVDMCQFKVSKDCVLSLSLFEPSVWFSCSVVSDSLRTHELQQARLPCPSASPRAYSHSYPLSQWCHPTISFSVIPFSSCLQSFPASGSFPMSWLFSSGGQSAGVQHQSCQWIFRVDFL